MTRLKWKLISGRLEIVLILTQDRCTICAKRTIDLEIILDAPEGTPGDVGHVKSYLVRLEIVLVSVQDWCMSCAKCTIGSKIILDAPNGTPR